MTRTKRKTLKVLSALALTLVLCLSTAMTAFAGAPVSGTEASPAQASINKVLSMPTRTTIPTATFTFDVTRVSRDDDTTAAYVATMPDIGTKTIAFTGGETDYSATPGVMTVAVETGDILAGLTWPAAGVYQYTIVERDNTVVPYVPTADETFTWDNITQYDLYVYVDNGVSGLFVSVIEASKGTVGTPATPGDPAAKVNPTPGTPGSPGTYSDMAFTNTYYKTSGTNPANSALTISKVVTGSMANQSFYFDYSLAVTAPSLVTPAPTYKVYVMEGATVVTDATLNGVTIAGTDVYGDYFTVASGTAASVKLKHGQHLAFGDLHIGASYTITEAAATDWTPSVNLTVDGVGPVNTLGTVNTALSVPTTVVGDSGANTAAYSNAWKLVSPTGLDINDLPFILMLVLAAGAIVTFVVVKYRSKKARGHNS